MNSRRRRRRRRSSSKRIMSRQRGGRGRRMGRKGPSSNSNAAVHFLSVSFLSPSHPADV